MGAELEALVEGMDKRVATTLRRRANTRSTEKAAAAIEDLAPRVVAFGRRVAGLDVAEEARPTVTAVRKAARQDAERLMVLVFLPDTPAWESAFSLPATSAALVDLRQALGLPQPCPASSVDSEAVAEPSPTPDLGPTDEEAYRLLFSQKDVDPRDKGMTKTNIRAVRRRVLAGFVTVYADELAGYPNFAGSDDTHEQSIKWYVRAMEEGHPDPGPLPRPHEDSLRFSAGLADHLLRLRALSDDPDFRRDALRAADFAIEYALTKAKNKKEREYVKESLLVRCQDRHAFCQLQG